MFFVVSGTVRVKIQSVSGREILLTEISAGGCFGEIAAIDNQPRSSGIMAVTDVTIARMPASIFAPRCTPIPTSAIRSWR